MNRKQFMKLLFATPVIPLVVSKKKVTVYKGRSCGITEQELIPIDYHTYIIRERYDKAMKDLKKEWDKLFYGTPYKYPIIEHEGLDNIFKSKGKVYDLTGRKK